MLNAQGSMFNDQFSNARLLMENKKYDLEDRLVEYGCRMIDVVEALPPTRAGNYIAGQLIKCCLSPAFNYGEVQAADRRMTLFICIKRTKRMQNSFENSSSQRNDKTCEANRRDFYRNRRAHCYSCKEH